MTYTARELIWWFAAFFTAGGVLAYTLTDNARRVGVPDGWVLAGLLACGGVCWVRVLLGSWRRYRLASQVDTEREVSS